MPFLDTDRAKILVAKLRKADRKRVKRVILQRIAKKKKMEEDFAVKDGEATGPIIIKEEETKDSKYPPCWIENK